MQRELAALKASGHLASYALVEDKPLGVSDTVLTLQLTLNVMPAPAAAPAVVAAMRTSLLDVSTPVWMMGRAAAILV
jgi:hypothetical protein